MLSQIDYIVIASYLIIISVIGIIAGRKEKNVIDFFLAGRSMHWVMVFLSIMATEISAITFIGVPEEGFNNNYVYLQFAIGSLIGRYLIAYILLPGFFEKEISTIYEYLKNRFGSKSHIFSTCFFFITRIMASGVRLYAAALALSVATGLNLMSTLSIIAIIAVLYTFFGGLKAVMWTDASQIVIFFGGAFIALFYLLTNIEGGLGGVVNYVAEYQIATGIDKFQIFDFSFSLNNSHTLLVSIIFGCFSTFAALGVDQDLAQRLLSCKKMKESQKAIILTGYITFPVVILFLFLGTCLFVFFSLNPSIIPPDESTKIFPFFIVNVLPKGLAGLLIAGILAAAMSSLDSALNALASSAILDIYKPYFRKTASPKELLNVSRLFIIIMAIVLIGFAIACNGREQILFLGFKLVSFTYGALLGVFCVGILTKRGSDSGNVLAMLLSVLSVSSIFIFENRLKTFGVHIGWAWYIVIGTFITFITGICFNQDPNIAKNNTN